MDVHLQNRGEVKVAKQSTVSIHRLGEDRFSKKYDAQWVTKTIRKYGDGCSKHNLDTATVMDEVTRYYIASNEKTSKRLGVIRVNAKIGELSGLVVIPSERNKGIGQLLVEVGIKDVREAGGVPFCWIRKDNQPSQHLFENLRFKPTGDSCTRSDDKIIEQWTHQPKTAKEVKPK